MTLREAMDVEAVIVNYRLGPACVRAANSIEEELAADRVWVVDNSEDPREVEFLKASLPSGSRLLVSESNIGFGAACNRVFGMTRSKGFLLLNPDAYLLPGALAPLVRHLESDRTIGAVSPFASLDVGGTLRLPDLLLPEWWQPLMTEPEHGDSWRVLRRYADRWRMRHAPGWVSETPWRADGIPGGHVLLRRRAVERSGGLFDPRFFMYYEDADLAHRMRAAGYTSWVVPASRAVHVASGSRHPDAGFKARMEGDSLRRYQAKHFGWNWRLAMWRAWSRWLPRASPMGRIETVDLEAGVEVPVDWQNGWLLEFSTHPLLLPACTARGRGDVAAIRSDVLRDVPVDAGYFRLGSARDFRQVGKVFRWRRDPSRAS